VNGSDLSTLATYRRRIGGSAAPGGWARYLVRDLALKLICQNWGSRPLSGRIQTTRELSIETGPWVRMQYTAHHCILSSASMSLPPFIRLTYFLAAHARWQLISPASIPHHHQPVLLSRLANLTHFILPRADLHLPR
jgi:hypothetical protein